MLKILLCCGGGFSSSAIAQRMEKEIVKQGLEDSVYIEFYPFTIAMEKFNDFDIVMCCPHLKISVQQMLNQFHPNIPIYLLPPKMYGFMILDEIIQDAKDIIEIYQETKQNPVHFPGEENLLRITRGKAYRNKNKG